MRSGYKMFKSVLCFVLSITLCMNVIFATAYASEGNILVNYEEIASDLKELGLFKGVSDTEFELDRAPSRVEAIIMLIRVLGKESEAVSGDWKHSFTDVEDWANNYVGYAYENGLSNGVSESEFGSENASSAMYLTFVLRSLGYSDVDGKDFNWDNPYDLATKIGILPNCVDTDNFMRRDVAAISYAALSVKLNGSEQTLAEKLINANVFTKEQFDDIYDEQKLVGLGDDNAVDDSNTVENVEGVEPENEVESSGGGGEEDETFIPQEVLDSMYEATVIIETYYTDLEFRMGTPNRVCEGVLVAPEGIVATTYHAIKNTSVAVVKLTNGLRYKVYSVVHYDKRKDIALLKLTNSDLETKKKVDKFPTVAYTPDYKVGDVAVTLSGHDTEQYNLNGEFISLEILADNYGKENTGYPYLQISLKPQPIDYAGSPIFNLKGELIALSAAESAGYTNENGNGAAIPAKYIAREHFSKDGIYYRDVYIKELKEYLKNVRETGDYKRYWEIDREQVEPKLVSLIDEGTWYHGTFSAPENVDLYYLSVPTDFWLYADAVTLDPASDNEVNNKYFAEHGITYSEALTKTLKVVIKNPYTKSKIAELKCENKLYMGKVQAVLSLPKALELKAGTYCIEVSQNGEMYDGWKDREYVLAIVTYLID